MQALSKTELIEYLKLIKHPEGGWYREVYRSPESLQAESLPERYGSARTFSTSIFFLLGEDDYSSFHRLKSDESWYYHLGDPLQLFIIFPDGTLEEHILGNCPDDQQEFQVHIPAACWFAARVMQGGAFCLLGASVSPGFEFEDFELAECKQLEKEFPDHSGLIKQLCRK